MFSPVAALAVASGTTPQGPTGQSPVARLIKAVNARTRLPAPMVSKTVWNGLDVDGDGASDFVNPTGQAPRLLDAFGYGEFGASRDGGSRQHEGVDYTADADQAVAAPISGFVTKIGYAYGGDDSLRFVEITNPALGYVARAFYVDPDVLVGQAVRLGETIGTVASLQSHYPGITDHVHLEVMKSGERLNAETLIVARTIKVKARTANG
ncbi:MAG: M23 family metallopeptidase [Caulobacteraceae bacterium]|nr:MAG: M23 family metallopeptidase [Caulobacteraceae bacterium]